MGYYAAVSLNPSPDHDRLRNLLQGSGFVMSHSRHFFLGSLDLLVLQKPEV
jgi:hypothetical protein